MTFEKAGILNAESVKLTGSVPALHMRNNQSAVLRAVDIVHKNG